MRFSILFGIIPVATAFATRKLMLHNRCELNEVLMNGQLVAVRPSRIISCSFKRISSPFDRSKLPATKENRITLFSKFYSLLASCLFLGILLFFSTAGRSGPIFYSYTESYSVVQSRNVEGNLEVNVDRASHFQTNDERAVDFSSGELFDLKTSINSRQLLTNQDPWLTEPWF